MIDSKFYSQYVSQFRDLIIATTLKDLGLYSKAAERLVLGTGIVESNLMLIRQVGGGPARGVYQCEVATHKDIWANYLKYKKDLGQLVGTFLTGHDEPENQLYGNHYYSTAICRIHYLRQKAPLPAEDDFKGMAEYHKRYYNTAAGKTDTDKSTPIFARVVREF